MLELAYLRGVGVDAAVTDALREAVKRAKSAQPLAERLDAIALRCSALPDLTTNDPEGRSDTTSKACHASTKPSPAHHLGACAARRPVRQDQANSTPNMTAPALCSARPPGHSSAVPQASASPRTGQFSGASR